MHSMQCVRGHRALSFWKFALRSKDGQFGTLLNLIPTREGGTLEIRECDDKWSQVAVRVPAWCCDKRGVARLEAVTAMLDEVSTYVGTVQWDKGMRPGVSIQLAARELGQHSVGPDDTVLIETSLRKIGKTIGFVDVLIKEEKTGKPIIQASHIKFMPMGLLFDIGFHPAFQNISLPVWEKLLDRRPHAEYKMPESIESILKLENLQRSDDALRCTFDVGVEHGNPIGSLHGGCGVMVSTLASSLYFDLAGREMRPHSIKTNLLSGIPVKKKIKANILSRYDIQDNFSHSHTIVDNKGPCVETEVWWVPH